MQFPPPSFQKVFSNLSRSKSSPDNHSNITLFDDLPDAEKQAAIVKLQQLADQQPGSRKKWTLNWKLAIMLFAGISFVVAAIVASVALAVDTDADPDLVAKLRMANTNLDRMKLLPKDSDWFFDFTKQDKYTFAPGGVINANAATFPATVGQGMTMVSQISRLWMSVTDENRLFSTWVHAQCSRPISTHEPPTLWWPCQAQPEPS